MKQCVEVGYSEQYVAERFTESTGKKVRRANSMFYNRQYPFMLANVDRLIVGENAGLECREQQAHTGADENGKMERDPRVL